MNTMNTVDNFIADQIRQNPYIYTTRIEVLATIFCTPTIDFLWKNGEIVDSSAPEYWSAERNMDGAYEHLRLSDPEAYSKEMKDLTETCDELREIVNTADKRATEPYNHHQMKDFWFGEFEKCLISQIPDNVTPEWRKACEEVTEVMPRTWNVAFPA